MTKFEEVRQHQQRIRFTLGSELLVLQTESGEVWFRVNPAAAKVIDAILSNRPLKAVVQSLSPSILHRSRAAKDIEAICTTILDLLVDPFSHPEVKVVPPEWEMSRPAMGELTLTRSCQARCQKCYMAATGIEDELAKEAELTLEQIKHIVDRLVNEAGIHEIIISGGEPTLRRDIEDIIRYCAKEKHLRVHMITNGIKSGASPRFAQRLADAGLTTAQVSLDSPVEATHNLLIGRPFYKLTVKALVNLSQAGIFAYPNSTLCKANAQELEAMPAFLKAMGITEWSANGLIPSGRGQGNMKDIGLTYSEFAVIVPRLKAAAEKSGVKFSWILPVPYCIMNAPAMGWPEKGCTAANAIAITNSKGQFVACNNLPDEVLGDLLHDDRPFLEMWNSPEARYWRERKFAPLPCQNCVFKKTCCGACPLYWRNFGDITEIADRVGVKLEPGYTENWRTAFEARPRLKLD